MVILVAMVWWFTWFRSRAIVISIYIYKIYGDGGGWWCSCQRLTSSPHGWAPPYQPSSQLFNYSWHQGMPIGLRVYLPADGLWMYISSFQSLSLTTLFSSGSPCEAHPSHYLMATSPINRIRTYIRAHQQQQHKTDGMWSLVVISILISTIITVSYK